MSKRSRTTVAVVGAGLAGLGAAWNLSRRGFAVAVLEREEVPGGRARSESLEGFALEAAGPVLSSGDRKLLAWIDEVGRRDELLPLRPVVTSHCGGDRVARFDSRNLLGIGRIPGIRAPDALRLVRLPRLLGRYGARLDPERPERAAALDDRSIGDFARLYFGNRVLAHWLGPFVTATSLGDADELSRALFLRRFRVHANERPGVLRGALGELADAAAEQLVVKYGVEALRIDPRADGRLALAVRAGGAERVILADAVVVATPAPDAARLAAPVLVAAEREGLGAVRYQSALSLALGLRRPFHPHPQHIQLPHGSHSPIESVLLEPGVHGGRVPEGRGLALLRATSAWSEANFDLPDETVCKELLAAFARFHPGAHSAVLFKHLFRVRRAQPRFEVGHYRRIARLDFVGRDLRRDGRRLYFAGDYLMDPSLEGALAAAIRAADAVADDLAPTKKG